MSRNLYLSVILVAALWSVLPVAAADSCSSLTIDVAEDFSRFVYTPVSAADQIPERGSTFVTEGFLFPGGTIPGDGSDFDPLSPGAIGQWICRGVHLVSAADLAEAPIWVHTAQHFQAFDGSAVLTTEGLEGNIPVHRSVSGAGSLMGYAGDQYQELLGFNATGGVNYRVTFTLCVSE